MWNGLDFSNDYIGSHGKGGEGLLFQIKNSWLLTRVRLFREFLKAF